MRLVEILLFASVASCNIERTPNVCCTSDTECARLGLPPGSADEYSCGQDHVCRDFYCVLEASPDAPGCGDGVVLAPELCDDGNKTDGDGCDNNCNPTGCGNGVVTAGEQCDDGNTAPGDGCSATCAQETCGNGIVDPGENCDDGNLTCGTCSTDCQTFASGRATGTLRMIAANDIVQNDTFTLNDGINPPLTFEFTKNVSSTFPNIPIFIDYNDTVVEVYNAVEGAIALSGFPLLVSRIPAPNNTMYLTHQRFTSAGNIPIMETVTNTGFMVTGMLGGAGGNCVSSQSCRSDNDCLSNDCSSNKCR